MVWMREKACLMLNQKGFHTHTKEIQHRNLLQYFMQLLYKNADNKFKSQFSFNQEMKIHVIKNIIL